MGVAKAALIYRNLRGIPKKNDDTLVLSRYDMPILSLVNTNTPVLINVPNLKQTQLINSINFAIQLPWFEPLPSITVFEKKIDKVSSPHPKTQYDNSISNIRIMAGCVVLSGLSKIHSKDPTACNSSLKFTSDVRDMTFKSAGVSHLSLPVGGGAEALMDGVCASAPHITVSLHLASWPGLEAGFYHVSTG